MCDKTFVPGLFDDSLDNDSNRLTNMQMEEEVKINKMQKI